MVRVTIGYLRATLGHPRVTMGHLRVTIGHPRVTVGHSRVTISHLMVTISHLRVTISHLRLTSIGYLKATIANIRVTLGRLMVTLGHLNIRSPLGNFRQFFSISNPKANTTELHPKVRKTCSISFLQLLCVMISHWLTVLKHKILSQILIKKQLDWFGKCHALMHICNFPKNY